MLSILLFVHTVLCLTLIGLVLIQQGKGADMGAAFGGGSNTVFGAAGAADFITRLTTGVAIAFMVSSVFLVNAYSSSSRVVATGDVTVDPLQGSVLEGASKPSAPVAVGTGTPSSQDAAATPAAPEASATVVANIESATPAPTK
jgi:preprotein translocase subunit SecG